LEEELAQIVVPNVKGALQTACPAIVRCKYSQDGRYQNPYQFYKRITIRMAEHNKDKSDERSPELKDDLAAQLDELGTDPTQVGPRSAGQTASSLGLSAEPEATEDSVEGLSDTDQGLEAAAVEGLEDAADHPERPTHTHEEYGNPEDSPPRRRDDAA
jgi:hypothetical protein